MILKNIDVVLAFAAVMLILSLIVTTLVQMVVSLLSLRGANLVRGVSQLFQQLDPSFTKAISDELSRKLLSHPAVARPLGRVTQAISKEEFVRLANDLAAGNRVELSADSKGVLKGYLEKTTTAMETVKMAAGMAAGMSGIPPATQVGVSVQKIGVDVTEWFDTILDRTRDTFGLNTRIVTAAMALAMAFGLQIDALSLFRQLSDNDEARNRIVASTQATLDRADQVLKQAQPQPGAPAPGAPATQAAGGSDVNQLRQNLNGLVQDLKNTSLQIVPGKSSDATFVGMLLCAMLLSLGAPFWFNMLRGLANLRPSIAQVLDPKDKAEGQPAGA